MTVETSPETPILFSAPMINALLAGQKTQTRRVLTRENAVAYENDTPATRLLQAEWPRLDFAAAEQRQNTVLAGPFLATPVKPMGDALDGCLCRVYPRAYKGERMWVRETWASAYARGAWGTLYAADNSYAQGKRAHEKGPHYNADDRPPIKWRPSIFMPRWASRLTLSVTEVRVQRLQDISGEDAIAEGITIERCGCEVCTHSSQMCSADQSTACIEYARLWESINGDRPGCSWDDNPWVIARTFTVEPAPCVSQK